jgi:hypothetical protein
MICWQKEEFSVTCWMRYVHLTKAKPSHKRQNYPLVGGDGRKVSVMKKSLVMSLKELGAKTK